MHFEPAKSARFSQTYTSAELAKKLSYGIMLLNAISGATFVGGPLLLQFLSAEVVEKIMAFSALTTVVLNSVVAQQAESAQRGRLNARGLIYTGNGKMGLDANAPTTVIPTSKAEEDRLLDVMPYVEGYQDINQVFNEISHKTA